MLERSDFFQRAAPMYALHAEGRYADALHAADGLAEQFPGESAITTFWRLCLLTRLGRHDEALRLMAAATGSGWWWSEEQLRHDDDLATLQGDPAFEAMLAESEARHAAAQKTSRPDLFVCLPDAKPPYPLLIALHGRNGSPARDLVRWQAVLPMGWVLAMPQSSQLSAPGAFLWDDMLRARNEIAAAWRRLLDEYEIEPSRIIIGGFSQGGALAVQVAVRGTIPARGFIAVVPGPSALVNLQELARSAQGLRGYVVAGGRDPQREVFIDIQALLSRNGVPCEIESHPNTAHEFPPDFDRSIKIALDFLFA